MTVSIGDRPKIPPGLEELRLMLDLIFNKGKYAASLKEMDEHISALDEKIALAGQAGEITSLHAAAEEAHDKTMALKAEAEEVIAARLESIEDQRKTIEAGLNERKRGLDKRQSEMEGSVRDRESKVSVREEKVSERDDQIHDKEQAVRNAQKAAVELKTELSGKLDKIKTLQAGL